MNLIRFSRKTILMQALKYARNNLDAFAAKAAQKWDVPVLDEAEEEAAFKALLGSGLLGLSHALGEQRLLDEIHISKRQLALTAIDLIQDNLSEFAALMLEGREEIQRIAVALLEPALEGFETWIETTPHLD